jgi:hypothetical protein
MPPPPRRADKLQGSCICQPHSVQSALHGLVSPKQEGKVMAGNFEGYETAAERLVRIHADHKDLRIHAKIVEVVRDPETLRPIQYIVESSVFYGDVLIAVDVAEEMVGSSFINKSNALENASTSATGRSLSLAGYMGTDPETKKPVRPTQQDMEKSKRVEGVTKTPQAKAPAAKREYTEEEKASAFAVFTLVETQSDVEELKAAWQLNLDLLDVVVEGATLRDHILARKAALNG